MPPSRHRDQYIVGRTGSFLAPTVTAIDSHLRGLRVKLRTAHPLMAEKIRADVDLLLDRRRDLQQQVAR